MIILTPEHELWNEFIIRLGGPEGCNFRDENGKTVWNCAGDHVLAAKILQSMDNIDIEATLNYFMENGDCCDCEVLFNVDPVEEATPCP